MSFSISCPPSWQYRVSGEATVLVCEVEEVDRSYHCHSVEVRYNALSVFMHYHDRDEHNLRCPILCSRGINETFSLG